jgi:putative hydrolase of the HAD superfamily
MGVIRAVLFDYGLVLSGPPDPAAWERMRAFFDVDEATFYAAYWRHRHEYDRGALNGPAFWAVLGEELGGPLNEAEVGELMQVDVELWTQPNQPMIDWAAELRRAGVKVGVLSNLGDAMEAGVMSRFAWLAEFNHRTFSHRLLMLKPEAAIYQHALEGLGVPADEVLFIDDRKENVEAAREAGMVAIQYLDHAGFVDEMRAENFEGLPLPS